MDCNITGLEESRTGMMDCIYGKVEINGKTFSFVHDRIGNQTTIIKTRKDHPLTRDEDSYLLSYIPVAVKDVHLPQCPIRW